LIEAVLWEIEDQNKHLLVVQPLEKYLVLYLDTWGKYWPVTLQTIPPFGFI